MSHPYLAAPDPPEPADWRDNAACIGYHYTFELAGDGNARHAATLAALHRAHNICAQCPVRQRYLDTALDAEAGLPVYRRWGIWGGLNPQQRWELDQREAS